MKKIPAMDVFLNASFVVKYSEQKMEGTYSIDEINEWYGNQIEGIINNSFDDINVYRVIL